MYDMISDDTEFSLLSFLDESETSEAGFLFRNSHSVKTAPTPTTVGLNVTEQCNIRCTYCYFSGQYSGNREHNTSFISNDQICKAIDLFLCPSTGLEKKQSLYFFGGEPLIALDQIAFAAEYAKSKVNFEHIALATNGLLFSDKAVSILKRYGIYVAVSVDGPTHDRFRIDARGNGTLDRVLNELEDLYRTQPDYFSSFVSTSCVVPYDVNVEELFDFFYSRPVFRNCIHWDFDLILPTSSHYPNHESLEQLGLLVKWYWEWVIADDAVRNDDLYWRFFFASGFNIVHRTFWAMASCQLRNDSSRINALGASAMPGEAMITIRPNGDVVCGNERQNDTYKIGDLREGINLGRVEELSQRLQQTIDKLGCSMCFAARDCTLTLSDFDLDDFVEEPIKNATVYRSRCILERFFIDAFAKQLSTMEASDIPKLQAHLLDELNGIE